MSSFNLRAKKNLIAKSLYSLLNSEGFLVFFHNNIRFTEFNSKILFSNSIKSYVIKNSLFYNIISNNQTFKSLVSGPTGFIVLNSDLLFLNFFRFYFKLSRSGEFNDVVLLTIYWSSKNLFLSLENVHLLLTEIDQFNSLTDFIYFKYVKIIQTLISPFIGFLLILHNILMSFLLILNLKNVIKTKF